MSFTHFLGHINNESWLGQVGTFILVSFGPMSRAAIQQHYTQLRGQPQVEALDLDTERLIDFGVWQVTVDGMASPDVEALAELARESDNPVLTANSILKDVLLLTDEYDQIQVGRLALYQQGSLEVSVYLPDVLDGRNFLVDGAVALAKL